MRILKNKNMNRRIGEKKVSIHKKMWIYIILAVTGLFCIITAIQYNFDIAATFERLSARSAKKTALSVKPSGKGAITDTDITNFDDYTYLDIAPHTDKFRLRKPRPLLW